MDAFAKWLIQLAEHTEKSRLADQAALEAEKELDNFLAETIGFRTRSPATLLGTVEMIGKIVDMKKENT